MITIYFIIDKSKLIPYSPCVCFNFSNRLDTSITEKANAISSPKPDANRQSCLRACSYPLRWNFFNEIWQFLLFSNCCLCILFFTSVFARCKHVHGDCKPHEHPNFVVFSGPQCLREFVNKINIACKYFSISFSSQACLCMSFPMKNHSSMLTSNVCVNRELFELARKFSNSFPRMLRKRFVSMILHVE